MGDWRNYFVFHGRLNRKPYWLMSLMAVAVFLAVGFVLGLFARMIGDSSAALSVFGLLFLPVIIALVWASLSISVRRLHDRDKAAWWILLLAVLPGVLGAIPIIGVLLSLPFSIWAFVELGCLRGTAGSNKYGNDPLQPAAEVFA